MERINNKELNSHDLAREIEIVKLQEENKRLNGAIQTYDILLKSNIKVNEELKSQLRGTTHCFDEEEHNRLKEEITNLSKDVDMWNAKYNDMFDENKRLKEALAAKSYCKYAYKCDELDDCSREEYEDMANANVRLSVENCDLKEENQELKKYLKVPETCNLKTLEDYKSYYEDTTREQILEDTYIEYCAYVNLAHRYSKLKKQLEEWEHRLKCSKEMLDIQGQKGNYDYDEYMLGLYNGMEYIIALFETREPNFISGKDVEFTNNKTQQKEFINYLEDEIKILEKDILETIDDMDKYMKEVKSLIIEEILQKYKSIIGDEK